MTKEGYKPIDYSQLPTTALEKLLKTYERISSMSYKPERKETTEEVSTGMVVFGNIDYVEAANQVRLELKKRKVTEESAN